MKKKSKIVVISHIGRPNGKWIGDLSSLKPVCENLKKKLNQNIKLISKNIFTLKKENLFTNSDDKNTFFRKYKIL